jgi:predicted transcriptional regulator
MGKVVRGEKIPPAYSLNKGITCPFSVDNVYILSDYRNRQEKGVIRMKKRDSSDISADILRLATSGAIKTRIVYGANLNFKIVEGYLSRLTGLGLLENSDSRRRYRTTEKGLSFIQRYEELSKFGLGSHE